MTEPVTTQPSKNNGSSVELKDLNEQQLQTLPIREIRQQDDCCTSCLKCYCLERCFKNCPNTIDDYEPNEDDGFFNSGDAGFNSINDNVDIFSRNEPEYITNSVDDNYCINNYESENNDNFTSYDCGNNDNNDFGTSTCDTGDSGGGGFDSGCGGGDSGGGGGDSGGGDCGGCTSDD